jgi:EmrB/QacA subfamily drug resistance transporter
MLLSTLGTSIANVALPTLAQAFDASFQQVQWVVLAYLLVITALIVSSGRLGDLLGRRRVLLAGLAIFTFASSLCAAAPTLELLVAARALQGLGACAMMALTMAFVADTVPKERTGRAMGLLGTLSAVGTALGPSLGGLLIAHTHWRAIFLINLPLGLIALWLAWRHLPAGLPTSLPASAQPAKPGPRFDHPGTLLLALALAAYALAMTLGRGSFGLLNLALFAAAAFGAALFLRHESRAAAPLIAPALLRDRALTASLAANVLVTATMMTTLLIGPFYLARALGLSATQVGLVLSVGPITSAFCGVPAGRLADRLGAQRMCLIGLSLVAAGAALLALLPAAAGVAGYIASILVTTCGYALFQAANNTAVMAGVAQDKRGLISGMLNLSRNLGGVTGASATGALFAWASARSGFASASGAAASFGLRATFAIAALLAVLMLWRLAVTRARGR